MSHDPFHGRIPADRLYDTSFDMWIRREGEQVVVGATSFGLFLAGGLIAFTAKPRGARVALGRGLATVECSKTVMAVHSPLSLVIDNINEAAEERPQILNQDPYESGWMVRGRPLAWERESATLVDALGYADHVRAIEPDAVIES
jgi:glycine cleavage system H protein